jgi:hypothetical protein
LASLNCSLLASSVGSNQAKAKQVLDWIVLDYTNTFQDFVDLLDFSSGSNQAKVKLVLDSSSYQLLPRPCQWQSYNLDAYFKEQKEKKVNEECLYRLNLARPWL